jgi:hypothetical protein
MEPTPDSDSVVVYQAYPSAIGRFAVSHGYLGSPWSVERMTWVKPGFLGTMVRSDWARNSGQEVVLAITSPHWFTNSGSEPPSAACIS